MEVDGVDATGLPKPSRRTLRDLELEMGADYTFDLQEHWDLEDEDWKKDKIPEIFNGRTIADFVDPDILVKLEALEKEEEARELAGVYDSDIEDDETVELREKAAK